MKRWLFAVAVAILPLFANDSWAQDPFPGEAPQQAAPAEGAQPQRVQLTQEHIQLLQQIVQQMPEAQREELAKLPKEQQQAILLQILARVLQPERQKQVKEWLQEDRDKRVLFEDAERYPDASERIEYFIREKVDRIVDVKAIAFLHEGHDHEFTYKRLYRAKYVTPKDGKEYVADFLFEKEGPYLKVKKWQRVADQKPAGEQTAQAAE